MHAIACSAGYQDDACDVLRWWGALAGRRDLPQVLQDKYGGFIDKSGQFVKDFAYYAEAVFKALAPYTDQFVTFNEPLSICQLGYGISLFAPGAGSGAGAGRVCVRACACMPAPMHARQPPTPRPAPVR